MNKKKTLAAKKTANNNITKSSKVNKKPVEIKEKKSRELKQKKQERKQENIRVAEEALSKNIDKLSASLSSMGGVSKEKLSASDKVKTLKLKKELAEKRKQLHENRRIRSLKRRLSLGEKSEEETKKSIEDLKKELNEQKRYDILTSFSINDKPAVNTFLEKSKIQTTYIGDTYFWVKNTDCHVLEKLRSMPIKAYVWPYKAVLKASKPTKEKKPTNNTSEVKKAAKTKRKLQKMNLFTLQHVHKTLRDKMKANVQLKAA